MKMLEEIANEIASIVPDATIYLDQQVQGFSEPSFYVYAINITSDDELMRYQMRRHNYCVMYFPVQDIEVGINEQCENMRNKLLDGLQYIHEHLLKVKDKELKIIDGALQLTFSLSYRVVKSNDSTLLNDLEIQIEGE